MSGIPRCQVKSTASLRPSVPPLKDGYGVTCQSTSCIRAVGQQSQLTCWLTEGCPVRRVTGRSRKVICASGPRGLWIRPSQFKPMLLWPLWYPGGVPICSVPSSYSPPTPTLYVHTFHFPPGSQESSPLPGCLSVCSIYLLQFYSICGCLCTHRTHCGLCCWRNIEKALLLPKPKPSLELPDPKTQGEKSGEDWKTAHGPE